MIFLVYQCSVGAEDKVKGELIRSAICGVGSLWWCMRDAVREGVRGPHNRQGPRLTTASCTNPPRLTMDPILVPHAWYRMPTYVTEHKVKITMTRRLNFQIREKKKKKEDEEEKKSSTYSAAKQDVI